MKTKFITVMTAMVLSACAWYETDKTPLSPHGQLNACLRDEVNEMRENGRIATLGKVASAQKAARFCLGKLEMTDAFSQNMAYRNAEFLFSGSDGISLK